MATHELRHGRDGRDSLGPVSREVADTGYETIVTDKGREIAVVIDMDDYERLHQHADIAEALQLRDMRANGYRTMSLGEMLDALGVSFEEFSQRAG